MTRQLLTRAQALKWNPDWSFTDVASIEQHFDRLHAHTFYVPPSGGYVGCIDDNGQSVMMVHAGYIDFRRGLAPPNKAAPACTWVPLSTFRPHASPTIPAAEGAEICPLHHIVLPLTGICDDCR